MARLARSIFLTRDGKPMVIAAAIVTALAFFILSQWNVYLAAVASLATAAAVLGTVYLLKRPVLGLYLVIAEMIFLGLGHIGWLKVRILLFLFINFIFVLHLALNRGTMRRPPFLVPILFLTLFYPLLWGWLGLSNGFPLADVFSEVNVFFLYLYFFLFWYLITQESLKAVVKFYLTCIVLFAAYSNLVYIFSFFSDSFHSSYRTLMDQIDYGIIFSNTPFGLLRIYPANGLFFQLGLAIILSMAICASGDYRKRWNLASLVIFAALIETFTRGFWLGAAVSLLLVLALSIGRGKNWAKAILVISLSGFLAVVSTQYAFGWTAANIFEWARLSFEFIDPASNLGRLLQYRFMMEEISQAPILGTGFGKSLPFYETATGAIPISYELYYLKLMMKTGIVGMALWSLVMGFFLWQMFKLYVKTVEPFVKALALGLFTGMVGFLITSSTNPYLDGANGTFVIVFYAAITARLLEWTRGDSKAFSR